MRPDFALDFRENQIGLLHRTEGGWVRLGQVEMTDPDLDAALGYLRATALGLSPRGIASQLILPNDLILYTRLEGLPSEPALRAQQIGQGLVGRTPYDLADLVYDWTDDGAAARVAVVARETLTEAEDFATQHRFNPVSFAAWPMAADFDGEVWFGTTAAAQNLLSPGEVVERDAARAFVILPEAALRPPVSAQDFEMGQAMPAPQAAAGDALPHMAAANDLPGDVEGVLGGDLADGAAAPDLARATLGQADMPAWAAPVPDVLPIEPALATPELATPAPTAPDLAAPALGGPSLELAENSPPAADAAAQTATGPDAAELGSAAPPAPSFAAAYDALAAAEPVIEPQVEQPPLDETPVYEAPMAEDVPLLDDPLPSDLHPADAPATAPDQDQAQGLATAQQAKGGFGPVPKLGGAVAGGSGGRNRVAVPPPLAPASQSLPMPEAPSLPAGLAGGKRPAPVKHVPAILAPNAKPKAAKLAKPKPKSRTGLGWVLTLLLLLTLVAIAALSQIFMPTTTASLPTRPSETPALAAALPPPQATSAAPQAAAPGTKPVALAGASEPPAPPQMAGDLPNPNPNLDKALKGDQTAKAAPLARPNAGLQDAVNLPKLPQLAELSPDLRPRPSPRQDQARATPAPPTGKPAANPVASAAANSAAKPEAQPDLANPDLANPDLALARQPLARPALGAPTLGANTAPAAGGASDADNGAAVLARASASADAPAPQNAVFADPRLANARPAPRPQALGSAADAPAIAVAVNARAIGLRPAPRPETGENLAQVARLGSAPASLVASAALNAAEEQLLAIAAQPTGAAAGQLAFAAPQDVPLLRPQPRQASASAPAQDAPPRSPLALAISPRPALRPADLARAFEQRQAQAQAQAAAAAEAAASQAAAEAVAAELAAASAPAANGDDIAASEALGQEEVTRDEGGPGSRTLVAKQSTQKNAINLSQANLVGIFGRNDNRYALIRRANGTFKKLKVGDRFDGGRVAAITETEVRYEKGGELVALSLPNG